MRDILSARESLLRLKEGNARFVQNVRSVSSFSTQIDRQKFAYVQQRPFAIILCCSDSRAPAELIFDQGIGDLFVVRVAGNIVAPSLVGSVEFAASMFGSQLVLVMGHTNCGAVSATLDVIKSGVSSSSRNIQDIIQRILPQVQDLAQENLAHADLMKAATRANISASVHQLKHGSQVLESLVQENKLKVIGAEYCLETGKVDFFEEVT